MKFPEYSKHNYIDAEIAELENSADTITQADLLGFIKVALRVAEEILFDGIADDMPGMEVTGVIHKGKISDGGENE